MIRASAHSVSALRAAIVLCVCLAWCGGCARELPGPPAGLAQANDVIVVNPARRAPVIDGSLNDATWQRAARVSGFVTQAGKPSRRHTAAYVAYDRTALYVAFWCDEPTVQNLVTVARGRDELIEQDDSVEVYVVAGPAGPASADGAADPVMGFGISAAGAVADRSDSDRGWNAGWLAAARIYHNRWQAELAIPFKVLGIAPSPGDRWRVLLVRNVWTVTPEISSNVHVAGATWSADRFAWLVFR